MPRLYYFTPYDRAGLGVAYNQYASLLPNDDDWAVFMDYDAMVWCSQDIEGQLQDAIRDFPQYQVFTVMTNRLCVRCQQQISDRAGLRDERDLVKLKQEADYRARVFRGRVDKVRGFFAGFFFAFPKRIWKQYPFPEIGSQAGKILGVDSAWSRTLKQNGIQVGLLQGIMVTHFYRLDTGEQDVSHLNDPGHNQRLRDGWAAYHSRPKIGQRKVGIAPVETPIEVKGRTVILNGALRPPGGYKFRDEDGVTHIGVDFKHLVKTLTDYRNRIGKPLGMPEREIMAQFYERYPQYCIVRG
jgi:hypothetical protein